MLQRLLDFALDKRLMTVLAALLLAATGVWAFRQLKLEAYPDISDPGVVVITTFPGFAAEEVEQQVTVPVERALNNTPNVIARRSRTIFGLSVVELTFTDDTSDYFARQVVSGTAARCSAARGSHADARPSDRRHQRILSLYPRRSVRRHATPRDPGLDRHAADIAGAGGRRRYAFRGSRAPVWDRGRPP